MKEVHIANTIPPLVANASAAVLRVLRRLLPGAQSILSACGRAVGAFALGAWRFLGLPVYKGLLAIRLKSRRAALPFRGLVLAFATNRYLLHGALAVLLGVTVTTNLAARQAHAQDVGQRSLLFAIASEEYSPIVEEDARTGKAAREVRHLGSQTVISIPDIDFDYDDRTDDILPPSPLPSAIAVQPYEEPTATTGSGAPRTAVETYTVQEGDTIGTIAQKYGINVGSILWNNNMTERQYIRPGDSLRIPPASGLLVKTKRGDTVIKLAANYDADEADIIAANRLGDGGLPADTEIFIPGGTPPAPVQAIASRSSSAAIERNPSAGERAPTTRVADVLAPSNVKKPQDLDAKDLPKTRLLWPTSGRVITQYYGWQHTGVDIDGDYSSPLYASADGVVETAGWNSGGYGLQIVVDHGNGMRTRYAHASKMFVKVGDAVKRGQVIAMMGTTGRSTGTHLHYEVYVNNKRANPLTYIR